MNSSKPFFVFVLMTVPVFAQPATTAVGALQLTVTDAQAAPLSGVMVSYRRLFRAVPDARNQPAPAPGEATTSGMALSDAAGALAIPGLPAGSYAICASAPGLPYLDPCKWTSSPILTVSTNATTKYTLVLSKGVFLNVRVNDPGHLLPQLKDGPLGGGLVAVGVRFGKGAYLGAQNTAVDATGRDYQIVVPAGTPVQLSVFSRDVALADTAGKAVAVTGTAIPVQATAGSDQSLSFSVTGRLARPF